MDEIIQFENVTKRYNRAPALQNLNLTVAAFQIFGFLGPNGAGKTTTIKLLLNLIAPTQGEIRVFGHAPDAMAVRRRIGYLPELITLPPFLTAIEFLQFHGDLAQMEPARLKLRIPQVLEYVGLAHEGRQRLGTFSKGMAQRIGLAQAILTAPDLLILDEPTSGFDPIARKEMRDLLLYLKDEGATIFLNSHLLSEIEKTCDRIGILNRGKLIHTGPVHSYTTEEDVVELEVSDVTEALMLVLDSKCRQVERDGQRLILFLKESATPTEIPGLVATAGVDLKKFQIKQESLEDLFYRLVKKEEGTA